MDRRELIGNCRRRAVSARIGALDGWLVPHNHLRLVPLAKEPRGDPGKLREHAGLGPIVAGIDTPEVGLPWLPEQMQPFPIHAGEEMQRQKGTRGKRRGELAIDLLLQQPLNPCILRQVRVEQRPYDDRSARAVLIVDAVLPQMLLAEEGFHDLDKELRCRDGNAVRVIGIRPRGQKEDHAVIHSLPHVIVRVAEVENLVGLNIKAGTDRCDKMLGAFGPPGACAIEQLMLVHTQRFKAYRRCLIRDRHDMQLELP